MMVQGNHGGPVSGGTGRSRVSQSAAAWLVLSFPQLSRRRKSPPSGRCAVKVTSSIHMIHTTVPHTDPTTYNNWAQQLDNPAAVALNTRRGYAVRLYKLCTYTSLYRSCNQPHIIDAKYTNTSRVFTASAPTHVRTYHTSRYIEQFSLHTNNIWHDTAPK